MTLTIALAIAVAVVGVAPLQLKADHDIATSHVCCECAHRARDLHAIGRHYVDAVPYAQCSAVPNLTNKPVLHNLAPRRAR